VQQTNAFLPGPRKHLRVTDRSGVKA